MGRCHQSIKRLVSHSIFRYNQVSRSRKAVSCEG
nr:MAG TPA: Lines C-terminus [Caudoviricetes sp.]